MSNRKITDSIQQEVRQRALELCEYCHASEKWQYVLFTVDHVIPLSKNGENTIDNLALACFHCNRQKSNKITGIDPDSGNEVALFNPRKSFWNKHFIWSINGLIIIGLTPTGKATISTLNLNRERIINIRAADKAINRHPPPGDPIEK
ncbi:HNH endonuclease signature motif containing protein [Cronbergia sp. UHCC 0137]|uniref:HNH endonuclease n=1 Tax=Cronbergia sp. UHCC 0137 TaxID=3110239 RepID=UPI002B1EAD1F|nr:HNH endonuclease signature motif containing protein [Cronbergia sp. UHCC 0137]MEA5619472.1 HNH endonuclease signature motif containing protein [Cronbergia sp. UHCC 0137]